MSIVTPRRLRRASIGLTAAALALSLSACSGGSPAADGSSKADLGELKFQLSWIKNEEFSGEFLADSKGYYKDAGFSSVSLIPGPSTGVAELLSGSTQVALSDSIATGTAIATDKAPLKVIAATYQKNPFEVTSLTDKADITTPQQMVGKRIGVGDTNTTLFKAFLAANDIDSSKVTVVPTQDASSLTSGDVDGIVSYISNEPVTLRAENYDVTEMPFADNNLPFVAETIVSSDDTIKNKPDLLKAFLQAEIRGWTDAVADPDAGAKLAVEDYGKNLKLTLSDSEEKSKIQAEQLVVSDETKTNGLMTVSPELQAQTVKSLAAAGIDVTTSQLFDMSLLDAVYKEHPGLKDYSK